MSNLVIGTIVLGAILGIIGVMAYMSQTSSTSQPAQLTEEENGDETQKDKWHQRLLNKVDPRGKTIKGSFGLIVVVCAGVFIGAWVWDEFGAKIQGKGTEPLWQTMYPWEGELTRDMEDSKLLNPPGEGYPISIEIKDAFLHLVDFDKLDLHIVARINDKDLPPQRYNPPRGLKPDLNACQSYKVVLGSKSAYKKLREGVIAIRMDTTGQWVGPQASSASIVPL